MKLHKIRMTGFIGIAKGLGHETIELELSDLDGLVALEGDNGMGKTTLLENLQPFRTLPSRRSTLKNHCYLKNSQKDLTFTMNGDEFRVLVKMDPTTTRSDEGYIWVNGNSVVDGKVSNFDAFLTELLGSQNLFFNSIFCAQNSSKLSDMRPAELKALFAEFLRLDRYIAWENTAKGIIRLYESHLNSESENGTRLQEKLGELGNPENLIKAAEDKKSILELEAADVQGKIENIENDVPKLRQALSDHEVAEKQVAHYEKEQKRIQDELDELEKERQKATEQMDQDHYSVSHEIKTLDEILDQKLVIDKAVNAVKLCDNKIIHLSQQIDKAVLDAKMTVELINSEADKIRDLEKKADDLDNREDLIKLNDEMDKLANEIDRLKKDNDNVKDHPKLVTQRAALKGLEESAAVLENIDPACTSKVCGLITKSLDDKEEIPRVKAQLVETEGEILDDHTRRLLELNKNMAELVKQSEEIGEDIRTRKVVILSEIADLKKVKENAIKHKDEVEKRLGELQESRNKLIDSKAQHLPDAEKAEKYAVAASRLQDLNKQLEAVERSRKYAETTFTDKKKRLDKQLLEAELNTQEHSKQVDPATEARLKNAEDTLKKSNELSTALKEAMVKVDAEIDSYKKDLEQANSIKAEIKEVSGVCTEWLAEIAMWKYLQLGCSKDGLRALEIEGVAPVISGYANEMLNRTFGPTQTVRFQTQDEDGREVLDITVINADGSETLLSNLSGGERVWIIKALSLAQTLINQEKSGRHFQTSLMDEEDGALSNDKAMKFIRLYGTLMEMANMENCYFISHRPDAIAMADHRIKFRKGGISII